MLKLILSALATVACFSFEGHPITWEGRYSKAATELNEAQDEVPDFGANLLY